MEGIAVNSKHSERRRYRRVYFAKKEGIAAQLRFLNAENMIFRAQVADLGEGGMGFLFHRELKATIQPGTRLVLQEIAGSQVMAFLHNSTLQIRWILDTGVLTHVCFGCMFENLEESKRSKIRDYVAIWS